jgi:hypothetical protein
MRRIFSNTFVALVAGLCLRLFFVLKYPASSGDTILYDQMATNWLKHHVYAMDVGGTITPVDLRMPGYPAFLAIVYALTGRTGEGARIWVMLAQIGVDLLGCLLIARLAELLAATTQGVPANKRVRSVALWLAVLCPFTANYCAVELTEVFAGFWTALACCAVVVALRRIEKPDFLVRGSHMLLGRSAEYSALVAGFIAGMGTLFRPETPLLLVAAVIVFGGLLFRMQSFKRWVTVSLAMGLGCLMMLSPWATRNLITLGEAQFLAPKNSNLPVELVPYGFMAWEKTWLYRMKDCYLVSWKLNGESIDVEQIPARAFDTPEEKQRVAAILEPYNNDLTLTAEEDAEFAKLARERTARHPLRTYISLPAARAATLWFTPRIELIPVSGYVFPLRQMREEDPRDQEITIVFFAINLFYVGLGLWSGVRLWRWSSTARPAVAFLALFILMRTAFLTTLETPEPRYVLVCFPALIAMGAQVFAGRAEVQS